MLLLLMSIFSDPTLLVWDLKFIHGRQCLQNLGVQVHSNIFSPFLPNAVSNETKNVAQNLFKSKVPMQKRGD